jgi:nickel-type superoxide dismutase maturation protease
MPGDRLLMVRARRVRPGDVVVVRDPRNGDRLMVKRVSSLHHDGVFVLGDNSAEGASTDSRAYGLVHQSLVTGRIAGRYLRARHDRAL